MQWKMYLMNPIFPAASGCYKQTKKPTWVRDVGAVEGLTLGGVVMEGAVHLTLRHSLLLSLPPRHSKATDFWVTILEFANFEFKNGLPAPPHNPKLVAATPGGLHCKARALQTESIVTRNATLGRHHSATQQGSNRIGWHLQIHEILMFVQNLHKNGAHNFFLSFTAAADARTSKSPKQNGAHNFLQLHSSSRCKNTKISKVWSTQILFSFTAANA